VNVDVVSSNKAIVSVPEDDIAGIIGKKGFNINAIEKKLGMSIDIQPLGHKRQSEGSPGAQGQGSGNGQRTETVPYEVQLSRKGVVFYLDRSYKDCDLDLVVNGDYLLTAKSSKKGVIKIRKDNKIGKILSDAIEKKEDVVLKA